ncbi:DUF4179 domain-containing protein [Evtepia sp.]|uniref:DUF4179 domain-containing protein n=1 Tax=Evtepia sp. TaxID=2773933 RepID=UPI003F168B31
MKTYRETMDGLSFSPEQKNAMAEELLAAAQTEQRRFPRKYTLTAVIAALLALTVTACATGGFQALSEIFANILHPYPTESQTQTIDQLFTPIGVSATDNGVTLTVEGVIGDSHSTAVLYSIRRDSGEPLIPETEDTKNVSNGDNTLRFEQETPFELMIDSAGSSPGLLFLDFTLADSTLYFLNIWTYSSVNTPPAGHAEVTFENLYSHEFVPRPNDIPPLERDIPLVQGKWDLSFDIAYEDASISLPVGQTFSYKDLTGTITDLRLSPLSLHLEFDYTADREAIAARYDPETAFPEGLSKEQWVDWQIIDLLFPTPILLTFTDGSEVSISLGGDFSQEGHAILSGTFGDIYPLDTIESVTIGDMTIPVTQK